jgi:chemotaxis protein MotB
MSREKKKAEGPDPNAWLGTYADTITLLMTFFVLLYSMSTIDAVKFKSAAEALQSVLSGKKATSILEFNKEHGETPIVGIPVPTTDMPGGNDAEEMYENMLAFIEENDLGDSIEIKNDSRGYIFELKEKILFETGRAYLKENSKPILDAINVFISEIDNDIIIEGHTDNVPIHNDRYTDNWDLSAARALTVTRYFIESKGQEPKRFKPIGLGEYHPIVNNDNFENRAINRRVNILIVKHNYEEDGEN